MAVQCGGCASRLGGAVVVAWVQKSQKGHGDLTAVPRQAGGRQGTATEKTGIGTQLCCIHSGSCFFRSCPCPAFLRWRQPDDSASEESEEAELLDHILDMTAKTGGEGTIGKIFEAFNRTGVTRMNTLSRAQGSDDDSPEPEPQHSP